MDEASSDNHPLICEQVGWCDCDETLRRTIELPSACNFGMSEQADYLPFLKLTYTCVTTGKPTAVSPKRTTGHSGAYASCSGQSIYC